MIVDSSALVAIMLEQAGFTTFIDRITASATNRMSAASLLETSMVVNRQKGAAGVEVLRRYIVAAEIQIVGSAKQKRMSRSTHTSASARAPVTRPS